MGLLGLFSGFLIIFFIPFTELALPFIKLPQKFKLLAYRTYMLCAGGSIMVLGLTSAIILSLLFKEKARIVSNNIIFRAFVLGIIVLFLSVIPRYYLTVKVEKSNYVLCPNESSTSAKVSWDVYAESENLCKSK
jgi:hypothetical protein